MEKERLDKLNRIASRIILEEEKYPLDFELQLNMFKKMITTNPINDSNNGIELLLSREEVLKRVLKFYKTVDIEYYSVALDFLLQLKKNKSLEIFFCRKGNLSRLEQSSVERKGYHMHDYIFDETEIYIPTRLNEKRKEMEIYNKNTDIINDSITIVHEIAHALDVNKIEGLFSILADINENPEFIAKKHEEIGKKVSANNRARNIFAETTAITFEKLYMQYLMENTNYPKSNISNIAVRRFNNSLYNADECYDNLRIAKIKKENGAIRNDDIILLMEEYGESREKIEKRIERIIREKGQINEAKKYAIAGLFAPTIVFQYQTNGANVLKQYIAAVKNNSVDQIFNLLQIPKNQEGINTLFVNMQKQIEPYRFFSNERNSVLEK